MFLQRLSDLHGRIQERMIPSYHKRQGCRWILELSEEGTFEGFVETGQTKRSARKFSTPYRKRAGRRPPPYLLVDKPAYVLGLPRKDKEKWHKKAAQRHENYVALVKECTHAVKHPALKAFLTFLENGIEDARTDPATKEMKQGDLIIPRVAGTFLTQLSGVRRFWIKHQDAEAAKKSEMTGECLVCGQNRPIARTHPVELKIGQNRAGLITGNGTAFLSHGLKQSEIAPTCQPCARAYGESLRYLLETDRYHLRLGEVTWICWGEQELSLDPFSLLIEADPQNIRPLLNDSLDATQPEDEPGSKNGETLQLYVAALTSNISRLALRDWITTTVSDVKHHLARYFRHMRLLGRWGPSYHGFYALAGSTTPSLEDLPSQNGINILAHALTGRPLPVSLLHQALQRNKVEGMISHPRAALLKLFLLSNQPDDTPAMVKDKLTPSHSSPAYQCGRLLALLEAIQQAAIPNLTTTFVQRYYGPASTSPASVFASLLRRTHHHLDKLPRKEGQRGLSDHFQDRLENILNRLDGFPHVLNVQEQALFALGYYQQRNQTSKSNVTKAFGSFQPSTPDE